MKRKFLQAATFMWLSIFLILAFQMYWLHKLYTDEKRNLKRHLFFVLREGMMEIQYDKLNSDSVTFIRKFSPRSRSQVHESIRPHPSEQFHIGIRKEQQADNTGITIAISPSSDTQKSKSTLVRNISRRPPPFEEDLDDMSAKSNLPELSKFGDSISIKRLDSSIAISFKNDDINLPYHLRKLNNDTAYENMIGNLMDKNPNTDDKKEMKEMGYSFSKNEFELSVSEYSGYLFKKILWPLLFSLFMILVTASSFLFLYRNLKKQQKLTELKNDFINNITHELKTPIATVGVAIEALKNFNALQNPERTKEYLDISGNELNRLSILVDKVLRQSMFEKKDMELKKEPVDMKQLVAEILRSMQLQTENAGAKITYNTEGQNFTIQADKLHITSVIYNLLDNALKYSKSNPSIDLLLKDDGKNVALSVADNGIGIPAEFTKKVFEKFFRVPHGDTHDTKGYGLGLSYVAQVVREHGGNISVKSDVGKGSIFTVILPV